MTSPTSSLVRPKEPAVRQSYQSIKVENVETQQEDIVAATYSFSKNKGLLIKMIAAFAIFSALVQSSFSNTPGPTSNNEIEDIAAMTQFAKKQKELAVPMAKEAEGGGGYTKKTKFKATKAPKSPKSKGSKSNKSPKGSKSKGSTPAPTPLPTPAPTPFNCPDNKSFTITLMNMGNNTKYDAAFTKAKLRWESIIKCGLVDIDIGEPPDGFDWFLGLLSKPFSGPFVDDVVIGYEFKFIDGVGNPNGDILGQAVRLYFRPGLGSAISGIMQFDEDNFATETDEDAEIIILHEMGHILGLVNIGGLCVNPCTPGETIYGGPGCTKAIDEYEKLDLGLGPLKLLSKEPQPGFYTCAHWSESSFPISTGSSELMTPFFEKGLAQPISRVSVAALEESAADYVVDYSAADPFPFTVGMEPGDLSFGVLKPTNTFVIEDGDAVRYYTRAPPS